MKIVDIIPYDKHGDPNIACSYGHEWLTWPGFDHVGADSPYETTNTYLREEVFGMDKVAQEQISWQVFHNMRTGLAGGFPVMSLKDGRAMFFMPLALNEELFRRIKEEDLENDVN